MVLKTLSSLILNLFYLKNVTMANDFFKQTYLHRWKQVKLSDFKESLYKRLISLFKRGVMYPNQLLLSQAKPLNQPAGPRGLSDLRWCWTALPSTLFSSHIISVLRPQQTVTLHLMLWKWRGRGASLQCMTEAETRVHTDRNKDRHGLSHCRTQQDLWRALKSSRVFFF